MRNCLYLFNLLLLVFCLCNSIALANSTKIPILVYHDIHPSKKGSMTISTAKFEQQLNWLKDNGYTVIPLQALVKYLQGKNASIPEKSVVITADDGRKSVYTHMLPIVQKYNIPVTLFIFPSTISNSKYSMTWEQLKELQTTGLFDIQSHTYWHPNFKREKKRLSEKAYQKLVQTNLLTPKKILDKKLNIQTTLLAWPFGIYNDYLKESAAQAGYEMAFSIDARPARKSEHAMSQPRFMIIEDQDIKMFANIIRSN